MFQGRRKVLRVGEPKYVRPRSSRKFIRAKRGYLFFTPCKPPAGISPDCIVARTRYVPQFLCGSMCIESKFHNGILQVREPSLLQASDGMLVGGYAGKSQVKQNGLCLPRSEVTTYRTPEAGLKFMLRKAACRLSQA